MTLMTGLTQIPNPFAGHDLFHWTEAGPSLSAETVEAHPNSPIRDEVLLSWGFFCSSFMSQSYLYQMTK